MSPGKTLEDLVHPRQRARAACGTRSQLYCQACLAWDRCTLPGKMRYLARRDRQGLSLLELPDPVPLDPSEPAPQP